jgi:hypothetical protein
MDLKELIMVQDKMVMNIEADLLEAEKWFAKTYNSGAEISTEKIQMLILYRIDQMEKALDEIRHQTRMHWAP